jgi:hypothetical protein
LSRCSSEIRRYSLKVDSGGKKLADADYRVEKTRYGKMGKDKTARLFTTTTGSP